MLTIDRMNRRRDPRINAVILLASLLAAAASLSCSQEEKQPQAQDARAPSADIAPPPADTAAEPAPPPDDVASPPNPEWSRTFGTPAHDTAAALVADERGVFVAGTAGKDAYVRRYDSSGRLVWTRQFGTAAADTAAALASDQQAIYVAGSTGGALREQTNQGGQDAYLRKYTRTGEVVWTRQFGEAFDEVSTADAIHAIAARDGAVYVVGESSAAIAGPGDVARLAIARKYGSDGELLWADTFFVPPGGPTRAFAVAVSRDALYVGGDSPLMTSAVLTDWDAFVRKYTLDGEYLWTRLFDVNEQAGRDTVYALAVDEAGGVYAAGESFETVADPAVTRHFLRRYTDTGKAVWTTLSDSPVRGLVYFDAQLYAGGDAVDAAGSRVRRYTDTGKLATARTVGPAAGAFGALAVQPDAIYVAGQAEGDAFLVRVAR